MSGPLARIAALLAYPYSVVAKLGRGMLELQHRERLHLQRELSATQRLMPILMKQRNGQTWTDGERVEIRTQLHRMAEVSPYLVLLVMPGGLFLLPLLAWWLDRRRQRRH